MRDFFHRQLLQWRSRLGQLFSLLLLSSCLSTSILPGSEFLFGTSPPPGAKEKERIVALHKKLKGAEKERVRTADEIAKLQEEVRQTQLALVQRRIEEYEKKGISWRERPSSLFLEERQLLHEIIQAGPSPSSLEAEIVLDQILRIITDCSDDKTDLSL